MKISASLLLFVGTLFAVRSASGANGNGVYKLTASDGVTDAEFGWSVGMNGETAIVGAWQDDDNGARSGSVYVFDIATGNQLLKILPSDGKANGQFGVSVGINGDKLIVGARGSKTSVNASGAAYVFDTATGTQLMKLTSPHVAGNDYFGWVVDITGNIAIVSAERDSEHGIASGAAYLFDVATGAELFKLTASDAQVFDSFGISVATDGANAVVGAYQNRGGTRNFGSAYIFNVATGAQRAKLTSNDAGNFDWFGWSVDVSGNTAIVGAPRDDDNGSDSGSAYLFNVTTGAQLAKLTPSDGAEGDDFGRSVAISGNLAIVGAEGAGDNGVRSGAAYIFDVTTGTQLGKLIAVDGAALDFFGKSVSIDGNRAFVGARLNDDKGMDSGSAYLFSSVPEPSVLLLTIYGTAGLLWRRR